MQLNLTVSKEVLERLERLAASRGMKRTQLALEYILEGLMEEEPVEEEQPAEEIPTPSEELGIEQGMEVSAQSSVRYRALRQADVFTKTLVLKSIKRVFHWAKDLGILFCELGYSRSGKMKYYIIDTFNPATPLEGGASNFVIPDGNGWIRYTVST